MHILASEQMSKDCHCHCSLADWVLSGALRMTILIIQQMPPFKLGIILLVFNSSQSLDKLCRKKEELGQKEAHTKERGEKRWRKKRPRWLCKCLADLWASLDHQISTSLFLSSCFFVYVMFSRVWALPGWVEAKLFLPKQFTGSLDYERVK